MHASDAMKFISYELTFVLVSTMLFEDAISIYESTKPLSFVYITIRKFYGSFLGSYFIIFNIYERGDVADEY